jgi:Rrf2 family nitric oxide-sensitive transcriptional repressor
MNWYLKCAYHFVNAHFNRPTRTATLRLISFTVYGLRVLMRMAREPDRPSFTAGELAGEFRGSRNHLAKVISALATANYLETRRGRGGGGGGGATLACTPEAIRLGDVVATLEADQALVNSLAPGGNACTLTPQWRLMNRMADANAAFIADFIRSTLAHSIYRPESA